MNTVAAVLPMPPRRVLGAYLEEARSECLRYLRAPSSRTARRPITFR